MYMQFLNIEAIQLIRLNLRLLSIALEEQLESLVEQIFYI